MGRRKAERKGKISEMRRRTDWNRDGSPLYAALLLCGNCRDSKGFAVRTKRERGQTKGRARAFAPLGLVALSAIALSGCGGLPQIDGAPLPPEPMQAKPVYRDLADIPARPPVTPQEMNQDTIQSLMMDRAATVQTADDLRRQPFNQPDSAAKPGF